MGFRHAAHYSYLELVLVVGLTKQRDCGVLSLSQTLLIYKLDFLLKFIFLMEPLSRMAQPHESQY